MLTLHAATQLLADASDAASLARVAHACGFIGQPAPLDARARAALGLASDILVATVLEGRGILRALCVEVPRGALTSDRVAALAIRVQQRSSFALWLVLATERRGAGISIASAVIGAHTVAYHLLANRAHVVDSDAEAVRALAAAGEGVDLLVHARWCEVLGREALTQRFFRALERGVEGLSASIAHAVPPDEARTLSILTSTRLLFLSFLEAKGWLDGDHAFLRRHWDACMTDRGVFHRAVLQPLCFGTLNTRRSQRAAAARRFGRVPFLNGGLFTRTVLERQYRRVTFSDESLGAIVCDLLGRWRFTVREHHSSRAEAAVDPEMLGRAFECLMASRERRASGSFYTPRALVARTFDAALDAFCADEHSLRALDTLRTASGHAREFAHVGDALARIRILDPACGSGAFLVHALEELASLRARAGDGRDAGALRRDILARQLFGVDREPVAVWLCELRLWLAVVVETPDGDPDNVSPLPNLDANVRVGDALSGDAFTGRATRRALPLAALRERYARATGARKHTLARALASAERSAAITATDSRLEHATIRRRDIVTALRARDLFGARVIPTSAMRAQLDALRTEARELRVARRTLSRGGAVAFDFAAQFADVGHAGGFDLIIGNPPWVRLHRIPSAERIRLRARFVTYRDAGWRAGAAAAGAGIGFAAQVDLAALFVERALTLARDGGALALLVPAKLWRSLAGGGVRQLLTSTAHVKELEDWSEALPTFDAAVYPSLVVATRATHPGDHDIRVAEHHRNRVLRWNVRRSALALDESPGAPWLWLPPDARAGFDRVMSSGVPLAHDVNLRPKLGVKCGCNEAFIVAGSRACELEPSMLRPLLRGEGVRPWRIDAPVERIIFPHDRTLQPLKELPPQTRRWLTRYRPQLTARSDLRGHARWWTLFRVESADTRRARVVWADMSRTPRALALAAGNPIVPLNTCYVVTTQSMAEAHALAVWLNTPLAAAWLAALAEPARGGFRRMLGWTMALLPIPRDWPRAIERLAPLGERAAGGDAPAPEELLDAALESLGVASHQVEALLTWGHR